MNELRPQFLDVGKDVERRRIAYLQQPGNAPGILWLQGFMSDMISIKASALADWTRENNRAFTRFDYSGHGQSEGRFVDGTLGRWLEEAEAVFREITHGPQIIVGSSMGGNIALLLLRNFMRAEPRSADRIHGLVLIAPAWDMTEELMWRNFSEDVKRRILDDGIWLRPSQYGEPYPITRGLIEDGRKHLLGTQPWDPRRPVAIIHGRQDTDVPFAHSERLLAILGNKNVTLTEVPDGEHRLSRPHDLALLFAAIEKAG